MTGRPRRWPRRAAVRGSGTLLVLAVLAAPGATQAQDAPDGPAAAHDPVQDAVLERIGLYYADLSARDWDAYRSHFWPGATLTTVWTPSGEETARVVVTALEEFIEQAPLGPGSRSIFEERMLEAEVRVYRDLARVWARYEARFGDPGDVTEWRGIDAFTLMEHAGEWRIVSLAYTTEER